MPGHVRIGTSGWNYTHWKGSFYPESLATEEWFGYYATRFDTVEINNTFYHQPETRTFDAWRKQAPSPFLYAVKANRYITHLKRLNDPKQSLSRFLRGVRRLKANLGPLLFQLPPNWNPDLKRLEHFLSRLPKEMTHVLEFRNRSWLCDETYDLLTQHNVSLCVHDMLRRHPRRVTGNIAYVRLHGSGKRYGGRYRNRALHSWAKWMQDVAEERDVYAYFNNDAHAHAVSDAQRLRALVS